MCDKTKRSKINKTTGDETGDGLRF